MTYTAYHFTGDTLRDGRPVPAIGETLIHEGHIDWCRSGLYASRHSFDALQYAPGQMLHRVLCEDIVREDDDKLVCRRRTIIASIDATDLMRGFARACALDVIHLWDAPDVVRQYLEGDESLRAAAWDAANAARYAARAAWAAARAAADAANAAWAAARAAADAANAARHAAWYAAEAARDAARVAANAASAGVEMRKTQRDRFARMADEAFGG